MTSISIAGRSMRSAMTSQMSASRLPPWARPGSCACLERACLETHTSVVFAGNGGFGAGLLEKLKSPISMTYAVNKPRP